MTTTHSQSGISRRDLFKFGGVAAAGVVGASALASCSPKGSSQSTTASTSSAASETTVAGHLTKGLPDFLTAPSAITDIKETKEYDVIVIGAGAPGVPCALAAKEAGASVALIQKEATASAYGNSGSGIDLSNSDMADVENLVSQLMVDCQHRPNRALLDMWAKNSGEAVKWVIEKAQAGGAQVIDQGMVQHMPLVNKHGYNITFVTSFFGPKPYTTGDGMQALAKQAAAEGVEIFYSTPAEQLVMENGACTGVIAKSDKGHIKFMAKKAVVMATGDYQNDEEMLYYYQPDMTHLGPKQTGRTGDGHKMVVWAGGKIEDLAHTKMLHDFDAGPASMCDMPFMRTKMNGKRFCEENVEMSLMNCYLRSAEDEGHYCQVFDAAYMDKAAAFPGKLVDPEALKVYMPEEKSVDHTKGVFEGQINTFKADTLEDLAKKLQITDTAAFVASVKRWNELCATGKDTDFGLPASYLKTIDTPPYYGIHRHVRMSAICSGVDVNDELQCTTPDGTPIKGLYAIGNCAGHFYGGIDYPLTVFGLNLGRNYTQGYVTGKKVANL